MPDLVSPLVAYFSMEIGLESLASRFTSEIEIEKRCWMPVPACCSKSEQRINTCLM